MKKHYYLLFVFFISFGMLLAGCGKDGAVGPQGATGPAGPIGSTGPQGVPGNANVKVDTFTVKGADWIYGTTYWFGITDNESEGEFAKYFDRANTAVTDSVLNTGTVLVYFKSSQSTDPTQWTPMPFSFTENFSGGYTYNYAYKTMPGKIRLFFYFAKNFGGTIPQVSNYVPPSHSIKIVTVGGSLLSSIKQNHIDINNLTALSKFLGIKN